MDDIKHLSGEPVTEERLLLVIAGLEARLTDLQARMPAHSMKPAMLAELDELDEQLAQLRARLRALKSAVPRDQNE